MTETTLHVKGMTCGHCQEQVAKSLRTLPGVKDVSVDLSAGTAHVAYEEGQVSHRDLVGAVSGAGYQVAESSQTVAARPHRGCC